MTEVTDDLDALCEHVDDPRGWVVVLDFDGTLAPIVDRPGDAAPAPGAADAVAELAAVCQVAVLSGRALDDLMARLGTVPERVMLVGGHGSEVRRPDGRRLPLVDPDTARTTLDEVGSELQELLAGASTGWLVERKPTSLAVHHRLVPDDEVATWLPRVRARLAQAADRPPGYALLEGKAVLELRVAGVDKGQALTWLLDHAAPSPLPGAPPPRPLVVGDDTTDEDAFEVAVARGGVAARVATVPTTTSARFRLRDPSRVVTLLAALRRRLGEGPLPDAHDQAWRD